jgi:glutamate synthase (ferredoxin)
VEVLDTLTDGRLLDEIYRYEPGWGLPSSADQGEIVAIMSGSDEEETRTEGPPETAEPGASGTDMAGEKPSL